MYSGHPSYPRVPTYCPPGFTGRYTVVQGDTMFFIAQRFGVSLDALIAANPHIPNPSLIFPGDVLCVPQKMPPPPPPPPPRDKCPCPITLTEFIGRSVQVATPCGVVSGNLVFVGDNSITLNEHKTNHPIIIRCKEICFVRIYRRGNTDEL
ncbi:MAG: LysM peptidoglycan-binding domain-containing protein [Firmicutes bacterium]|nr:LysM peptidoglycan-binding domain-containing protein [Bacillota bacterium]